MDYDKTKAQALQKYLKGKSVEPSAMDAFTAGTGQLFSEDDAELSQRAQAAHPEAYAAGKLALPLSVPASALKEAYKWSVLKKK